MTSERRDCRGRKRGRTKRRWLDAVRDDIREKGLSGEEEREDQEKMVGRSEGRHQREGTVGGGREEGLREDGWTQ